MRILVLNSGSSSIKYKLFDMAERSVLASGLVERIGEETGALTHQVRNAAGQMTETRKTGRVSDHREGMQQIVEALSSSSTGEERAGLAGIGHRVVHGGEDFTEPTLIDEKVLCVIRRNVPLAPLHNPANLIGIEVALEAAPHLPQVAVFDTAFHQSIPPRAFHYAIPHELYTQNRVRRYDFHGTSHQYVAGQAAVFLKRPLASLNLLTLHLGNGASVAAVEQGRCVDTSMGMTPLEGLIMGTRCGDIDPALHFYLLRETGRSPDELDSLFNKESGLKGICGTNDMREVLDKADAGDDRARLAVDMFCYRVKKYIGAYTAVLGRVDALVFTAGIGERAAPIRQRCCQGLPGLGIVLDPEKNRADSRPPCEVQATASAVKILVISTDEELQIAEQTLKLIRSRRETRGG
ncbi:MAG: acetate/propionate family kinase [Thermodesulfobacteriota bacterium]